MHDSLAIFLAIDPSGWVAIGLFVASFIVTLISWFVRRREKWREDVDKKMARYELNFQRIRDLCGIELHMDE